MAKAGSTPGLLFPSLPGRFGAHAPVGDLLNGLANTRYPQPGPDATQPSEPDILRGQQTPPAEPAAIAPSSSAVARTSGSTESIHPDSTSSQRRRRKRSCSPQC
jgi:hypothetical protein